jgi:hypothetical protein
VDYLPEQTLCEHLSRVCDPTPMSDVDCTACLEQPPQCMALPGFAGAAITTHTTPTSAWLAVCEHMPPLDGPAGVAERLLLLVHYGIDWQHGWVSGHRGTYWDRLLPDRVITATYRADSLRRWWRDVAAELGSQPRTPAERAELEELLRAEDYPVLEVLRFETEALLLRTRIVADAVRATRPAGPQEV